jgi:hypothetical protein
MTQPLFILRQSPDWHSLSTDFKKGVKIDPSRFRPPMPVPGFPGRIVQLVAQWNAQMGVDFFSCRSRLKELSDDSIAQIRGAKRISYLDVADMGGDIEDYVAFYHDDDDWFAPDMEQILAKSLPKDYDVCVFPLVRIATQTTTLVRQGQDGRPDELVGIPRPFSHRYQSNNYGLNGRIFDGEVLQGMKDHILGSEYANANGLRDVYINRIVSATAKTPCSAQAVAQMFRQPDKAQDYVRAYVAALEALDIPKSLPWVSSRVKSVLELFSAALKSRAAPPAARTVKGVLGLFSAALKSRSAPPAAPTVNPAPKPAAPPPAGAVPVQPPMPAGGGNVTMLEARKLQHHTGVPYIKFLKFLAEQQTPASYLEVGTRNGESAAQLDCDMICIDPNFALNFNVVKKRRRSLMFQTTSDEFFASTDVRQIYPQGIDMAFLDGLHLYEFLLRDFMNTEKYCHKNSVVLLHDCLPFRKEITNRVQTPGAWTGDVWKVLKILKKYRPDVNVVFFDCPPTGLVACTNLDPNSTVLADSYDKIIAEFAAAKLPEDLFALYPRIDTKVLVSQPESLRKIFPPAGAGPRAEPVSALAAS